MNQVKITKRFEINENILTLYNLVNLIYYNSGEIYPKEIDDKLFDLLNSLIKYLEKDYLDMDIDNEKLIREITFMKC